MTTIKADPQTLLFAVDYWPEHDAICGVCDDVRCPCPPDTPIFKQTPRLKTEAMSLEIIGTWVDLHVQAWPWWRVRDDG